MKVSLSDIPLFHGIDDLVLGPLECKSHYSVYDAGEYIVSQGDEDKNVFFSVGGISRKQVLTEEGKYVGIGYVKEGEYFGEEFNGRDVPYSVIAIENSRFIVMPNDIFELAIGCSTIMYRVADKLTRDLNDMRERYISYFSTFNKVEDRVAATIRQYEKYFPVVQDDIAIDAGCDRSTVNRSIQSMIKKGILICSNPFYYHGRPKTVFTFLDRKDASGA